MPDSQDTELPSRGYTCRECKTKYRRSNAVEDRKKPPICPVCERYKSYRDYVQPSAAKPVSDGDAQLREPDTSRPDAWEAYCDECYYHFWRLRRKNERGWHDGYHIHTGEEARGLCDLLNNLEAKLTAAREEIDKLGGQMKSLRNQLSICQEVRNELVNRSMEEQNQKIDEALKRRRAEEQRDRLIEVIKAASVLIAAKGRHNTMLAYNGLRDALQSLNHNENCDATQSVEHP